jgi:hypothetical protein
VDAVFFPSQRIFMSGTDGAVARPWWKFGHVWLVISGPSIVVVASFFTLYLAVVGTDPVIDQEYSRSATEMNKVPGSNSESLAPSTQARNHVATGVPIKRTSP